MAQESRHGYDPDVSSINRRRMVKRMKKLRNFMPALIVFILSIVGVTTASAAKLGDAYTWWGVQIGWIIIIGAIVIGIAAWALLKAKPAKKLVIPVVILLAAGLLLVVTDVTVHVDELDITPGVSWSVTATEQQGGNITIDNDLNKIVIMCNVNSTAGTILDIDDTAFTVPIINFTIAPTVTEGLTDLELGATTMCSVPSPDASFTVSGTSYDLFSDVTGTTGDKDVMWTADGTDEYEWHYCTVQFGSSEVAELEINYNPAGISQLDAGTIKSSVITIGGETYTLTIIIVTVNT